jgi:hypothetical protein
LGALIALKVDRNYLIDVEVVLETDSLPLLGMIANCNLSDIAILRWIAYIKSLNLVLVHITGKRNSMADMLSKARYIREEDIMPQENGDECEDEIYVLATGEASTN